MTNKTIWINAAAIVWTAIKASVPDPTDLGGAIAEIIGANLLVDIGGLDLTEFNNEIATFGLSHVAVLLIKQKNRPLWFT